MAYVITYVIIRYFILDMVYGMLNHIIFAYVICDNIRNNSLFYIRYGIWYVKSYNIRGYIT